MRSFSWSRIFKRNNKVFPAENYEETVSTTEKLPVAEKPPPKTSGKCWLIRKLIKYLTRKKKMPEREEKESSASSTESVNPASMVEEEYTAHNNEAETFTTNLSSTCSVNSVSTMVEEEDKAHNEEDETSTPSLFPTFSGNPLFPVKEENEALYEEDKTSTPSLFPTCSDNPVSMVEEEDKAHNEEDETSTPSLFPTFSGNPLFPVKEENEALYEEDKTSTPSLFPTCSDNPVSMVEEEDKAHNEEAETSTPSLSSTRIQQLINRGLQNFGNSCYVNASLQCLFSAELFCTQLQCRINQGMHSPFDSLAGSFAKLWEIRESDYWYLKYALLGNLIQEAAVSNPEFTPYNQNDAHQFMFYCLEQMQQTLSCAGGVASECPIKANFGFQLTCIITCKGCGAEKRRIEEYNQLSLAVVADGSVEDCLQFFFRDEEQLECRCEVCSCSSASCRWAFHTLPRYLVLQLKRFELSADLSLTKHLDSVQINPKLHLRQSEQSEHPEDDDALMDAVFTPEG
ncbi:ubiquitin carboxyl-terminal hydrolase 37-like [Trichomycterus rosablanca]|uniref:ubiquitin carboxyl-terminal hydrolase 37-like n=1 Tax=Trichomycterus rosablanca TaxID=2290929 RepID=UPI002F354663